MSIDAGAARVRHGSFAALLRSHRDVAGLTQEVLAERAALSVRGLKYLEQGAHVPHPETVRLLADALALSAQDRALFQDAARHGASEWWEHRVCRSGAGAGSVGAAPGR